MTARATQGCSTGVHDHWVVTSKVNKASCACRPAAPAPSCLGVARWSGPGPGMRVAAAMRDGLALFFTNYDYTLEILESNRFPRDLCRASKERMHGRLKTNKWKNSVTAQCARDELIRYCFCCGAVPLGCTAGRSLGRARTAIANRHTLPLAPARLPISHSVVHNQQVAAGGGGVATRSICAPHS